MFTQLRNQYQEFIYDSFQIEEDSDSFQVTYTYLIHELKFMPKMVIHKKYITNQAIQREYLEYLFFQYGLFDLMNYYKLTCSPKIVIRAGYIDEKQVSFFKKVLYQGLGEYFYNNHITLSYQEFVTFQVDSNKKYKIEDKNTLYSGNLIPIGGGKDSIVTLELLKDYHEDNKLFMLDRNLYPENRSGYDSIYMAGYQDQDIVIFRNELDLQLLELNKKGYLNGHIPFSACLSMASFILAYLTHKKYIILSNEASANEGNQKDLEINHQYSKSYEYEKDFREYARNYLSPNIEYFSLLRPWNEYTIVQEFLKHRKYLPIFRSCNRGTKQNIWCNHCSKCLYVYIMLYPYLSEEELSQVFEHNLLDDKSLLEEFLGLILEDKLKPFECVGTKLEVNFSLQEALRRKKENLPYLLDLYQKKYYQEEIDKKQIVSYFNREHFIPSKYLKILENANER